MIWIILALLAAFFTSMTTILAKIGIKDVNSNFATFIRTGVVILCSLLLCIINKDLAKANQLTVNKSTSFLIKIVFIFSCFVHYSFNSNFIKVYI